MIIIDGTNQVLGRLATSVAKKLLKGEEITIINAEKIIITGDPKKTKEKYTKKQKIGSVFHGPHYPKKPNDIVRRGIKGMIPYKTKNGKKAYSNLKVYIGTPDTIKKGEIKQSKIKDVNTKFITIYELSKSLGWSG